jgi:hypothetical protein
MTITPKTTVHTLLKEYPFLLEYLAAYHPEFGKLTNPVLRRPMGRMATLDKAAQLANVPLNQLMNDVAGEIQAKTGARARRTEWSRSRQRSTAGRRRIRSGAPASKRS